VPRIASGDCEVFECRSGGGCAALLGLALVLAGALPLSLSLAVLLRLMGGDPVKAVVMLLYGAAIMVIGLFAMLWRQGTLIDRRRGAVRKWWGLLVPLGGSTRPLAAFDGVRVARERTRITRSSARTRLAYVVSLTAERGDSLTVEEMGSKEEARVLARELAEFTGLELADKLDLPGPLRDRAGEAGARPEIGEPPADARCRIRQEGHSLVIDIPPVGFRLRHVAFMAVGLLVPLVFCLLLRGYFWDEEDELLPYLLAFAGLVFVGFPVAFTWGSAVSSARRSVVVRVSPRELRVTSHGLVRSQVAAIVCGELESLDVVAGSRAEASASRSGQQALLRGELTQAARLGGHVIVARSPDVSLTFGAGLSLEELRWMRAVIWNVVTA